MPIDNYQLCKYSDGVWERNQYFDESVFYPYQLFYNALIDSQNRFWLGGTEYGLYCHQLLPTTVEEQAATPESFALSPPTPNPFNPVTTITYTLAESSPVTLAVYNVSGQKVSTLVDEWQAAGMHTATFDGTGLASGLYFARMTADGMVQTEKMVLIK